MRAKILNASAGSGKTYQLAYQYVRDVIEHPAIYRHILAVTFTNKATEEMKTRILKEIHTLAEAEESNYRNRLASDLHLTHEEIQKRAREVRTKILHDYSRFTVLTIDTFFQRILRAFIKELNLDLNYNIELETASMLDKSADALIEEITTNRELLRWLTRFVEERIEEGRQWDVREGILSLGNEIFKEHNKHSLNNPPSRKELGALVHRVTEESERRREIFQEMALEILDTIAEAGADINDFPYKSGGFMGWVEHIADADFVPYGTRVVKACEEDAVWGKPKSISQQLRPTLQPRLQALRNAYDANRSFWNTTTLLRETYRSFALLGDLYHKVQALCEQEQLMLLSETKYLLSEFISEQDAPFIYEKVGNRFERFLIDEFQDTSAREWENFLPLLHNAMAQTDKCAVLLVGDIKQSIYRWRGSDWKILHERARQELNEQATQVVHLEENWRSLPNIVHFNNELIARLTEADNRALNNELDTAIKTGRLTEQEAAPLRDLLIHAYAKAAQRPKRTAEHAGYISIDCYAEEPKVVERICALLDKGFQPSDIMILVRGATDGARIAAELLDFKGRNTDLRYRFDVMTQEALVIGSAPICIFLTAALRLMLNANHSIARALYNQYLQRPFDAPLTDTEKALFQAIRQRSPEEAFEELVLHFELQNRPDETAYLQALHEQIIAFCNHRIADIALFLDWWDEQGAKRSIAVEESRSTIEISTIHKAKGLEKPVVIIPYCSWALAPKAGGGSNIVWATAKAGEAASLGSFPVRYKQQMAESAFAEAYYRELVYAHIDNINLLYVALTRAAESLHIFLPREGSKHIGALLHRMIVGNPHEGSCTIGALNGFYHTTEEGDRYEFGDFAGPTTKRERHDTKSLILTEYPTAHADLRLRFPSQRYFEGEEQIDRSPRNFGILMHRAFEEATDRKGIDTAILRMQQSGILSTEEAQTLTKHIDEALAHPQAAAWFDGSWEVVRNEATVIVPHEKSSRRPDRVMIRGKQAVIVDYKFGERDTAAYKKQINRYRDLLLGMGYTEVTGYLWYVKLGKIEQVA